MTLENIVQGFDVESIEQILYDIEEIHPDHYNEVPKFCEEIRTLLNNFKQRRE